MDLFSSTSKIAAIVILSLMVGCEQPVGPPLETECKFNTPISLMVIEYDTQAELDAKWEYYNRTQLPDSAHAEGFATYNLVTQQHVLHVLKIRGQNDSRRIETLGHELMHSFCGDWHPRTVG